MGEPVFLLGAERSGMLLLELMLAAHSKIAWAGDFDFALDWAESEHADWPPLIPYWQQLAYAPRVRELRLLIDPTLRFPELVRSLLAQQRARSEAALFGASAHRHYHRLLRLWPDARFVYLKRGVPGAGDLASAALKALRDADREWRRIAAEIDPQRRLELRYESLVAEPGSELRRVCAFLGVAYDAAILSLPHATPLPEAPPLRPARDSRRLAALRFGKRFALAASRLFAE